MHAPIYQGFTEFCTTWQPHLEVGLQPIDYFDPSTINPSYGGETNQLDRQTGAPPCRFLPIIFTSMSHQSSAGPRLRRSTVVVHT